MPVLRSRAGGCFRYRNAGNYPADEDHPPGFDLNPRETGPAAPEFVSNSPEFALNSREFALYSPEFVLNSREFVLDSPEFALNSPEFVLNSREFALNSPAFALNSPEFAAGSPEFSADSPENGPVSRENRPVSRENRSVSRETGSNVAPPYGTGPPGSGGRSGKNIWNSPPERTEGTRRRTLQAFFQGLPPLPGGECGIKRYPRRPGEVFTYPRGGVLVLDGQDRGGTNPSIPP
jgi:hypothetical protein